MLDQNSPLLNTPEPPKALQKRSFAEARLREAVIACDLSPGSRVSEGALVERYGLNRAGVRAALLRLEADGFVEASPRHGWRVRPVTGAYIAEVLSARATLEGSISVAALGEGAVLRIAELAQVTAVLAGRREAGSRASLLAYDREIVETVAGGLGDIRRRWLSEILDHSDRIVRFFEAGTAAGFDPPDRRPLAAACAARDDAAVAAALAAAGEEFGRHVTAALYANDAEIVAAAAPKTAGRGRGRTAAPVSTKTTRGTIEWSGKRDS